MSPVKLSILPWLFLHVITAGEEAELFFADDFGAQSRGELVANPVLLPPPEGMGYTSPVPAGHLLKHWVIADIEADGPRRSFWCIPRDEAGAVMPYAEQAGRSRNSVAYVNRALPDDVIHYAIEFRQWVHDNDTIGFVLGATQPEVEHDGVEISYQRQLPGTDQTVPDIFYRSPWGEGRICDRAWMFRWVEHRLVFREGHLSWSQDGEVMLAGAVPSWRPGGWFGIRQCYERGTRYADVRITIVGRRDDSVGK